MKPEKLFADLIVSNKIFVIITLQLFFVSIFGKQTPTSIQDCSDFYGLSGQDSGIALKDLQNDCEERLLRMKPTHHTPSNFTAEEKRYISSLFRQLTAETWTYTENKQHSNRFKRHGKYRARYRREVRSAPHRHWERYVAGVRRLKFDMVNTQ